MNGLAARKVDVHAERLNINDLRSQAFQVHLDAGLVGIPDSAMLESVEIEVGVQFAIDVHEDVLVEPGGDTLLVVISGEQNVLGLTHVGTEEQSVAGIQGRSNLPEQRSGVKRFEIADAGTDVEDELPAFNLFNTCERLGVVEDFRTDFYAGEFLADASYGFVEGRVRDIDRNETAASLDVLQLTEDHKCLGSAACAEFENGQFVAGGGIDMAVGGSGEHF